MERGGGEGYLYDGAKAWSERQSRTIVKQKKKSSLPARGGEKLSTIIAPYIFRGA